MPIVVLPGQPLSSMRGPIPARMLDFVPIVSPTDRSWTCSRREGWSWCSFAVLLVSRSRAGPRPRGRGGHRQPLGSIAVPFPARMLVVVLIAVLLVSRCRPCADPRPRGGWSWCSSRSPSRSQPLGSTIDPWQARIVVVAFILRPPARRWDRFPIPRRRGAACWCSSLVLSVDGVRVSRWDRWPSRGRRGRWSWCSSLVLRSMVCASAVRVDPRAAGGADVRTGAHLPPPSAVGVHFRAAAGAERGGCVHFRGVSALYGGYGRVAGRASLPWMRRTRRGCLCHPRDDPRRARTAGGRRVTSGARADAAEPAAGGRDRLRGSILSARADTRGRVSPGRRTTTGGR